MPFYYLPMQLLNLPNFPCPFYFSTLSMVDSLKNLLVDGPRSLTHSEPLRTQNRNLLNPKARSYRKQTQNSCAQAWLKLTSLFGNSNFQKLKEQLASIQHFGLVYYLLHKLDLKPQMTAYNGFDRSGKQNLYHPLKEPMTLLISPSLLAK